MTKQPIQIQSLFNRIAPTYDLLNKTLSGSIDTFWRKKAISFLPSGEKIKILDLCAGTLDLSLAAWKKNPDSEVFAVDFSEGMLQHGKNKIPSEAASKIHRIAANGTTLPFENQLFDAVLCGFGIRNIPNYPTAIRELHRVLKPGGRVIFLEFFKPSNFFSKLFYGTYGRFVLPRMGKWIAKDEAAYSYLVQSIQGFETIEKFSSVMKQEGFHDIRHRSLNFGIVSIIVGDTK